MPRQGAGAAYPRTHREGDAYARKTERIIVNPSVGCYSAIAIFLSRYDDAGEPRRYVPIRRSPIPPGVCVRVYLMGRTAMSVQIIPHRDNSSSRFAIWLFCYQA